MVLLQVFLTFGFVGEAYVYRWQPAQQQYVKDWTVAKPGWIVETSTHSVNGEDMNPDGYERCSVFSAWLPLTRTALVLPQLLGGLWLDPW